MANSALFSPLVLPTSGLRLSSRTWVPAMVTWRGTAAGFVTQQHIDWYCRLAQGQPGVLVIEATAVRDVPSGPLLRINDDTFVPGLAALASAVKEASGGATRVLLQVIDFLRIRRRPPPSRFFAEFLHITPRHKAALCLAADASDSDVREQLLALPEADWERVLSPSELEALRVGERERINDVHLPHIAALPQTLPAYFARAAQRAHAAGFDGLELHFAHAYTMAAFLSPSNSRADGYGGPLHQRLRLPLEVFAAVKAAVPATFAVGCRYLADECIAGGFAPAQAAEIGVAFATAGFDFLSLSRGGKFEDARQPAVGKAAYPYTGDSGVECISPAWLNKRGRGQAQGRNVVAAKQVRSAVRAAGYPTPVVVTGGLHTFEESDAALVDGSADVVGAARQALADPLWLTKLRQGRASEIRQCTLSNYCEGLDQMHKVVTCKLWDRRPLAAHEASDQTDGRALLPPEEP